ncbi:hypothetical protein [Streptomyces sp. NPDC056937]|uniref:hypothetical protein n=1 Tax=Streptomyces sp. NPDC056937 TaxID=3345969 RepID=UPI00363D0ED6
MNGVKESTPAEATRISTRPELVPHRAYGVVDRIAVNDAVDRGAVGDVVDRGAVGDVVDRGAVGDVVDRVAVGDVDLVGPRGGAQHRTQLGDGLPCRVALPVEQGDAALVRRGAGRCPAPCRRRRR